MSSTHAPRVSAVLRAEEGIVRLAMFAAMAALLVLSLCVPEAFDDRALLFACAYACVRGAHIVLFMMRAARTPSCATRSTGWR